MRLCPCTLDALRRLRSVFGSLLATPPLSMCCWGVRDWKADDCSWPMAAPRDGMQIGRLLPVMVRGAAPASLVRSISRQSLKTL